MKKDYPGHDDGVIKWRQFPRYWPFVRGIQRSPVNSPHEGQWRGALTFSLIYAWTNGYDVTVMIYPDLRHHMTGLGHDGLTHWSLGNGDPRHQIAMSQWWPRCSWVNIKNDIVRVTSIAIHLKELNPVVPVTAGNDVCAFIGKCMRYHNVR